MRKWLKYLLPPIVISIIRNVCRRRYLGIKGNYQSYKAANEFLRAKGLGNYSSDVILKQVYSAIEQVRLGKAKFERDGVLFDKKEYNYPLLANICYTLSTFEKDKCVNILDFGGSLGSSFFQIRDRLAGYQYKWHIVEQMNFVEFGREHIPEIVFHNSIEDYRHDNSCDICILSGVVQYFDEPYDWLKRILASKFKYIIVDRTLFSQGEVERCAIQYVPPEIYDAQYPIWLLSRQKVIDFIISFGYELDAEWKSFDMLPVRNSIFCEEIIQSEGFLFRLK